MGAQLEIRRRVDLRRGTIKMEVLDGTMFSADIRGNVFRIEVYDDGQPFNVGNHAVYANFILSDNTTIHVTSLTADAGVTSEGNIVTVPVPYDAYLVPGMMDVVIKIRRMESGVAANETKTTIAAFRAYVQRSSSGHEVTPTREIVDLETLVEKIDEMEAGTAAANTAASAANTAAGKLVNMDATATARAPGEAPTAAVTTVSGHYRLSLGLPKGDTGEPARVVGYSYSYGVTDDIQPMPDTWSDTMPTVPQGKYLWIRTAMLWNDNTSSYQFTVSRQGLDGSGSVSSVNGISPDSNHNVTLPKDTEPFSSSANLITSGGVYTERPIMVALGSISVLPVTKSHASIKSTMRPIWWRFSNPGAINSNLTVETSDGSLTVSGTLRGATSIWLMLVNTRAQITPT